ncbi:unnamed protein product [Rotaria socialis]|uniref:Uncharacterized protein n=1 Tax=Rotaria socialis TaxID=392032 RepID=A0A818AXH4_9BILA|nr:unnamed protein product [Rotaria socialis]CAF4882714.1 unnamed protein product [Rotaria socialis]
MQLSSVFSQLCHFSLKLKAFTSISDPLVISGDIIQQLCIDRLQPMVTYIFNLLLYATDTFEEKRIFNSLFKVPFIQRQQPRVFIQELNDREIGPTYHCFRMAYNVYTLEIFDGCGILFRPILNNHNLTTLINQQIKSLEIFDITWTLQNAQRIRTLLSNRLSNLKKLSFNICDAYRRWKWKPSCIVDGKNKFAKRIVTPIYLLVNKLQKLVSLRIGFSNSEFHDTSCFPHLIRRQLHQYHFDYDFRPMQLNCDFNNGWPMKNGGLIIYSISFLLFIDLN